MKTPRGPEDPESVACLPGEPIVPEASKWRPAQVRERVAPDGERDQPKSGRSQGRDRGANEGDELKPAFRGPNSWLARTNLPHALSPMTYNVCTEAMRMGTTRVNFRLPEGLIEKADLAAEISHKNRTEVVTEALREYLRDVEDDEWFREAVVELYLDDVIGFETLEGVVGRQDAESIRASKELLDRGDELAEELADL